jgi:hypothetical protein
MCLHEGREEKQIENTSSTSVHTISQPTLLEAQARTKAPACQLRTVVSLHPELSKQLFRLDIIPRGGIDLPCTAGSIAEIEGVSSPPFGTIFFQKQPAGTAPAGVVAGCFRKKGAF